MNEPSWLIRVIEYCSNETDELVGEIPLPATELSQLQEVWNAEASDPMVECFRVEGDQVEFVRNVISIEFDFDRYSYFLVAYTTDWEATVREGGYLGLFPPP